MSTAVEAPDLSKLSLDELFEEMKKLPDWNRFPLPEVFYEHFKVKKPQPQSVAEACSYNPFIYRIYGPKPEIRGPAEGGVREIKDLMTLPVEVKVLTDENGDDTTQCLTTDSLSLPKEDNTKESQPESGPQ